MIFYRCNLYGQSSGLKNNLQTAKIVDGWYTIRIVNRNRLSVTQVIKITCQYKGSHNPLLWAVAKFASKIIHMQTMQQPYSQAYLKSAQTQSVIASFLSWCKSQEEYRFGWLAVIIAIHGCVLTPITVLLVTLGGNSIYFWVAAISAMAMALITNLAAMSTKVTIPVFFLSVLIDITIIGISLYNVLMP